MPLSNDMEDKIAINLLEISDCFVYQLPSRPSSKGYNCRDWNLSEPFWTGRVRIMGICDSVKIVFVEQRKENIFAETPVIDLTLVSLGDLAEIFEPALDSSRYFIMKIQDPKGPNEMLIGFGFRSRSEAFDFNETIRHQIRLIERHRKMVAPKQESERINDSCAEHTKREEVSSFLGNESEEANSDWGEFQEAAAFENE